MRGNSHYIPIRELLAWINELLQLNYTDLDDFVSGAAHCQVMDMLHPGTLPFSRVNFGAQMEHECVANYKLLQRAFEKCGIEEHPDWAKLARRRPQDTLHFVQWLHSHFDRNYQGQQYDALERRKKVSNGSRPNRSSPIGRSARKVVDSSTRATLAGSSDTGNGASPAADSADLQREKPRRRVMLPKPTRAVSPSNLRLATDVKSNQRRFKSLQRRAASVSPSRLGGPGFQHSNNRRTVETFPSNGAATASAYQTRTELKACQSKLSDLETLCRRHRSDVVDDDLDSGRLGSFIAEVESILQREPVNGISRRGSRRSPPSSISGSPGAQKHKSSKMSGFMDSVNTR